MEHGPSNSPNDHVPPDSPRPPTASLEVATVHSPLFSNRVVYGRDGPHRREARVGTTDILTILFTDLVGSTGALARLVEERAEKLRQMHFSVLREAISRTQGTEVKNLGDGLMVAFAAASDAVADRPAGHRRLSR